MLIGFCRLYKWRPLSFTTVLSGYASRTLPEAFWTSAISGLSGERCPQEQDMSIRPEHFIGLCTNDSLACGIRLRLSFCAIGGLNRCVHGIDPFQAAFARQRPPPEKAQRSPNTARGFALSLAPS